MAGEVGSGPGSVDGPTREAISPRQGPGGKREPSGGIRFDNVGRGAAGVAGAGDALHGTEWGHAHLECVAFGLLGEKLQGVPHRLRTDVSARADTVDERCSHGRPASSVVDTRSCHGSILPDQAAGVYSTTARTDVRPNMADIQLVLWVSAIMRASAYGTSARCNASTAASNL